MTFRFNEIGPLVGKKQDVTYQRLSRMYMTIVKDDGFIGLSKYGYILNTNTLAKSNTCNRLMKQVPVYQPLILYDLKSGEVHEHLPP